MAADEDEPALVTGELPMTPSRAGDRPVFTGWARPVLLPDLELTLLEESDDPTEVRRWLGSGGDGGGGAESTPDRPRPGAPARLAHGAIMAGLIIAAMLIVAVVIALAAR